MTQPGSISCGWPLDETAFELRDIVSVEVVPDFGRLPQPGTDRLGQFGSAHAVARRAARRGAFTRCPELPIRFGHVRKCKRMTTARHHGCHAPMCPDLPRSMPCRSTQRGLNLATVTPTVDSRHTPEWVATAFVPRRRAEPAKPEWDMGQVTKTARKRGHCVRWLCGQCHAGQDCTCIPQPQAAQPSSDTTPNPSETTTVSR